MKNLSDFLTNALQTHEERISHIVGEIEKIYNEIEQLGRRQGEQLDGLNEAVKTLSEKLDEHPYEDDNDALAKKVEELQKLKEKVKQLTQDTNRQLAETKERLKAVEDEARKFARKLEDILLGRGNANLSDMVSVEC